MKSFASSIKDLMMNYTPVSGGVDKFGEIEARLLEFASGQKIDPGLHVDKIIGEIRESQGLDREFKPEIELGH